MRKDQSITARLDGDTAESVDILARLQNVSHAEIIRRAVRHLAISCNVGTVPKREPKITRYPEWYAVISRPVEG